MRKYLFKSDVALMDFFVGTMVCLFGTYCASAFLVLLGMAVYVWAISDHGYYLWKMHQYLDVNAVEDSVARRYRNITIIYALEVIVFVEFCILDL